MADEARLQEQVREAARRVGMTRPAVQRLAGGSRNHVYRAQAAGASVIVRLAGQYDAEYLVARQSECEIQRLAAQAGLAPAILLEDHEGGLLVTQDAGPTAWTAGYARSGEAIRRVAAWMACLHGLTLPSGLRQVDFTKSLRSYRGSLRGIVSERTARSAAVIRDELLSMGPAVLCHNDLHHSNLLESAGRLLAIDWEYAGVGHRVMDLAGYAAYHDLDAASSALLLDAYAAGGAAIAPGVLDRARWLFEAVWLAWLELRRRLEAGESDELAATRRRLMARVRRHASEASLPH